MRLHAKIIMVGGLALALLPTAVSQAAPSTGDLVVVQAAPDMSVAVTVDGRQVGSAAGAGDVLGPFELSAGKHVVEFADPSGGFSASSSVRVAPGGNSDVVLHRPAAVGGDAVVNAYRTPSKPIGPRKARVLVAHTATVAPADVSVDGEVVFTNIANGEFAEADLPAGTHKVALLPTGQQGKPILGPLAVTLKPMTVTMVYAVGTPTNGSMNVISHTARLSDDGTVVPGSIDTGTSDAAAHLKVTPFAHAAEDRSPVLPPYLLVALAALGALVIGLGTGLVRRSERAHARR